MSGTAFENHRRVISELAMRRTSNPHLAGLVVEGVSDRKVLERFVNHASCDVVFVGGKKQVLETVAKARSMNFAGVIGVIDRDGDLRGDLQGNSEDVFLTDCTDLNTMIFASEALLAVVVELSLKPNDMRSTSEMLALSQRVRLKVLNAAYSIGVCRRLSARNGWMINFKHLNLQKFIDFDKVEADHERMRLHLDTLPRRDTTPVEMFDLIEAELAQQPEMIQIVQGHDLVTITSICSLSLFGRGWTRVNIEQSLRLAYSYQLFQKTKLHFAIKMWQEKNSPYCVFAEQGDVG